MAGWLIPPDTLGAGLLILQDTLLVGFLPSFLACLLACAFASFLAVCRLAAISKAYRPAIFLFKTMPVMFSDVVQLLTAGAG